MPASVPTASEFNDLTLQVTGLKDLTAKLDARIKALETPTSNIYDDFKYNFTFTTQGQKTPNGKWQSVYSGYGTQIVDGNGLVMQPQAGVLRASLIQSTQQWGDYLVEYDVTNEQQVVNKNADGTARTPEQWMVPWCLIRYLDNRRHYYLYCGINKMEFGKKDAPAEINGVPITQAQIETYQKTLWTGGPATPIGTKRHVGFQAKGDVFTIWVDGTKVMEMTDVSSFKNGSWCPYVEGSRGRYQMVKVVAI